MHFLREAADLIPGDRMALFRLIGKANTRSVSGQSRAIFELDPTSSQYFQDSFFGISIWISYESMNGPLGNPSIVKLSVTLIQNG